MDVEKREKAVRITLLLTEAEFTELCGLACNNEAMRRMNRTGRDLFRCVTGVELREVKTRGPYTKRTAAVAIPNAMIVPKKKRRWKKQSLQELEQQIVEYLSTQRYATKYQIANKMGNPKPLCDREFMDKLVTKGSVAEVNWRKMGLKKGIYYAVSGSPALE